MIAELDRLVGLVLGDDDLLSIAVRYGYGSAEAFDRAFRSVHGVGPGDVRRDDGPLRTQPQPLACPSSTRASTLTSRRTSRRCPRPSTTGSKGWATPSRRACCKSAPTWIPTIRREAS